MKYKPEECILLYNNILKSNNQNIRIVEWKSDYIKLSNGFIICGVIERNKFFRRIKGKIYYNKIDDLYSGQDTSEIIKNGKREASIRGGKACIEKHGDRIIETAKENLRKFGYHFEKGHVPWCKGKTKENNISLKKLSKDRIGEGNPMYGKKVSDEAKLKQSKIMREKILNGEFTPNIHNSNTHWQVLYNGRKYRSSWEALFSFLHPNCLYEKIRIPYYYENKNRIYITDFVDDKNRIIYEIKPYSQKENSKIKSKMDQARKWCNENGYNFLLITEKELFNNIDISIFENFDDITKELLRKSYETYTKNENRKT